MITFLQTFGELVNWHPHIHALVTDGIFPPDLSVTGSAPAGATFMPLPDCPTGAFLLLWQERIFALLVERDCITRRVVYIMRSWKHSGFSVDRSVHVHGAGICLATSTRCGQRGREREFRGRFGYFTPPYSSHPPRPMKSKFLSVCGPAHNRLQLSYA